MFASYKDTDVKRLLDGREREKKFPPDILPTTHRKLVMLDAVSSLKSLRVTPGNRLEKLSGNRNGQHSIRINDQYRICFIWDNGNAYDVEIAVYHQTGEIP
ncbi:type II toxin-antitoxin system RelE/ParE family toxin [Leptolinea tardivitalis]|uniref:type II toxin-antitoxin system RelE/ParE family toxin n=1 Tax=Leptolinea tardivitalis TaxID=229920 RepID=UPI0007812378|nr:type II toxin-antitoxin system RelE/ParE family toxin [Leptolinea tardivitalis]